jgi:hypothetical protein
VSGIFAGRPGKKHAKIIIDPASTATEPVAEAGKAIGGKVSKPNSFG